MQGIVAMLAATLAVAIGASPAAGAPSHFGFNEPVPGTAIKPDDAIRLTRLVGGNMIRATVDWRIMEPQRDYTPSGYWEYHRGIVDQMLAAGIRPMLVLGYAPAWARNGRGRRCGDAPGCLYPPADTKAMNREWREFVTKAAQTFPEAVLEIWNEPNWPTFWAKPSPNRFAELQAIAYRAIKRVDPSITVLSGGLSGVLVNVKEVRGDIPIGPFLKKAYRGKHSLRRFHDGISLHSYAQGELATGVGTETGRRMATMRRLQRKFNDDAPIWITETGISTGGPDGVGADQQAAGILNRIDNFSSRDNVAAVLVANLVDGGVPSWGSGLGIVQQGSLDPKPAFCALVVRAGSTYRGC
jgi:Cellulase (glycosyl hydrolase family 5)